VKKKTRILISKLGLDGHDRGAKLVAHTLKKAGMDVIYLGIRQTVRQVVDTAVRDKVDYLGLSFLAGDHMTLVSKVVHELKERQADNIRLIVGGIILQDHVPELKSLGVRHVFLPGTPLEEIANYIKTDAATGNS
jgi:methylmalonyl-CoA mutase C-terminal domain/subunit